MPSTPTDQWNHTFWGEGPATGIFWGSTNYSTVQSWVGITGIFTSFSPVWGKPLKCMESFWPGQCYWHLVLEARLLLNHPQYVQESHATKNDPAYNANSPKAEEWCSKRRKTLVFHSFKLFIFCQSREPNVMTHQAQFKAWVVSGIDGVD